MTQAVAEALIDSLGRGHEQVHVIRDRASGLQAVIAVHSTVLGPALGGLRIRHYADGLPEALDDALRLSSAMTLKAAAAGLQLGGGKAVVVDDGEAERRAERLVLVAQAIDKLGGDYITAEDIGTTTADMDLIAEYTRHVVGRSERDGIGGDPSPATARTVFSGIDSALHLACGRGIAGACVGIIGLGKVGGRLARMLTDAGAQVMAHDPSLAIGQAGNLEAVECFATLDELLRCQLDVLAPCAVGGMLDAAVVSRLSCRVVCGAANNPLASDELAGALHHRNIVYVPDFLANCGGLIVADAERRQVEPEELDGLLMDAECRIREVLTAAMMADRPALDIACQDAVARIKQRETWQRPVC